MTAPFREDPRDQGRGFLIGAAPGRSLVDCRRVGLVAAVDGLVFRALGQSIGRAVTFVTVRTASMIRAALRTKAAGLAR